MSYALRDDARLLRWPAPYGMHQGCFTLGPNTTRIPDAVVGRAEAFLASQPDPFWQSDQWRGDQVSEPFACSAAGGAWRYLGVPQYPWRITAAAARRGFGQAPRPAPPGGKAPQFDVVTREGVSFKLMKPDLLTVILTLGGLSGVTPTVGKKVSVGSVTLDASAVAWVTPDATAERLDAWLTRMRADGNAVIGTDLEASPFPAIDGKPLQTEIESMMVVTRDLALVGAITKQDANAVVLFEPAGGWKRPSTTKAILIGGAALALVAVGALALRRKRS